MPPETSDYIEKARECLAAARIIFAAGVNNDAGRAAYIAGLNAAQAYIFAKTGKIAKTHKGAHALFYELIDGDPCFSLELKQFLSRTYKLKEIADYEVGPDAIITPEYVADAIKTAELFIDCIVKRLGEE